MARVAAFHERGKPALVHSNETLTNTPIRSISAPRENLRPDTGQFRYQALRTRFLRIVPLLRMVAGAPVLKRGAQKLLGPDGLSTPLTTSWRSQIVEHYSVKNERPAQDQRLDLAGHGCQL